MRLVSALLSAIFLALALTAAVVYSTNRAMVVGLVVVVVGAEQLAVIDTEDALLVCPLSRVQEVMRVVEELQKKGRSDLL